MEPAAYSPNYKVVSSTKGSSSLNISVALLKPGGEVKSDTYVKLKEKEPGKLTFLESKPEFSKNLSTSIESIMINKGYKVVGAYESWEAMTYDDKKSIDFLVIPEFNLKDTGGIGYNTTPPLDVGLATLQPGEVSCSGSVNLKGDLGFTILEPLSREKIFVKKFDLGESSPIEINVEIEYGSSAYVPVDELNNSCVEAWNNTASKSLENIYNKFIETFQNYFPESEEAKMLSKQVHQLKSLKRF